MPDHWAARGIVTGKPSKNCTSHPPKLGGQKSADPPPTSAPSLFVRAKTAFYLPLYNWLALQGVA